MRSLRKIILALFLVSFQISVFAAGFAILEKSAKREGTALAGSGSAAMDASAVWFNPAGMSRLGDSQLQISGHYVMPKFEFNDQGSNRPIAGTSVPLLPDVASRRDAGVEAFVPAISYVRPINNQWHFGLALNAPFGLSTDYGRDWRGRYQAVRSEITSLNLNPALARRLGSNLAVGFGVDISYMETSLSNAIDLAAACAELAGGACPNGAIPGQGQFDGFVENSGDDIGLGYNAGLLWELTSGTRVGIAWRSGIDHDLEGEADFASPETLDGLGSLGLLGNALGAAFRDSDIEARLRTPESVSLSLYHRFGDGFLRRFAVMVNADWTGWSSVDELRIRFDNPAAPSTVERFAWENVWRLAIGGEYYVNDRWTLRCGVALDESPVSDASQRSPRLPGNDRRWIAFGASRSLADGSSIDFALAHTLVDDTAIDHVGVSGDRLVGEYDSDGTILSLEYNRVF